MQKIYFILMFALILFSCGQNRREHVESKKTDTVTAKTNVVAAATTDKFGSLIAAYISRSQNEMIGLARHEENWLFDRTEKTDTASYFVYQIGHDVTDEGNTNPRFVADQWIFIDSLKGKLYEYDLPNDSLIEWKN